MTSLRALLRDPHFRRGARDMLDFAPGMLRRVGTHCCRLAGDLEHLPLAAASIDLYWSSLAVQWCDLRRALAEAREESPAGDGAAAAAPV